MSNTDNLKSKVIRGIFWQYFQRIGNQLVHFLVSIVLARLLTPENFGTIALIGVFISISNIFIDSGFGSALIQKKDIDSKDCSSVFYLNMGVSILLYALIFMIAPIIAKFYNQTEVCSLLRVLSVQILFMGLCCVQNSILVRNMKFKINFIVNIIATIISCCVGILMAYKGFGVWSLVYSQLTMQISVAIGLWYLVRWMPKFEFSFERVKILFAYSSKILGGSLISVIYNNLYNLIIGKCYTTAELGYYNRGQLIPTSVMETAANSLNGVLFPALSNVQSQRERHLYIIRQSEKLTSFIVFFVSAMMIVLAPTIIELLLGEKWLAAVPFMQIVSVTLSIAPLYILNQSIQTSVGRSDLYLKSTGLSKIISIVIIVLGALVNVYVMVIAGTIANIVTVFITGRYNKELVGYSLYEQFSDIMPSLLLSVAGGIIVYSFTLFHLSNILTLILGGLIGSLVYLGMAYLIKLEALMYLLSLIRK